jgi:competence ComEA-like helix-hairpin-helix protein
MGIIVLGAVLMILVVVRMTMHYWVRPEPVTDDAELRTAWEHFKDSQRKQAELSQLPVNINTADSATLVSLTGIGPKTAEKILEYRRQGKDIKNYQQLEAIQHIPDNAAERLKQEIRFSDSSATDK